MATPAEEATAELVERVHASTLEIELVDECAAILDIADLAPDEKTQARNENMPSPDAWAPGQACPCTVCGRPVDTWSANTWWVEAVDGDVHSLYPRDAAVPADDMDPGYMGHHPVGPTCAKKIPERYRFRGQIGAGLKAHSKPEEAAEKSVAARVEALMDKVDEINVALKAHSKPEEAEEFPASPEPSRTEVKLAAKSLLFDFGAHLSRSDVEEKASDYLAREAALAARPSTVDAIWEEYTAQRVRVAKFLHWPNLTELSGRLPYVVED